MAFSTSFTYEAIDKISPALKKMEEQSKKLEKVLEDALKDPKLSADKLKKALSDAMDKPLPKAKKLNQKLKDVSNTLKSASKATRKVGDNMMKFVTLPVTAGFAAMVVAGGKYEDSLASLSAITGLQGKALKSLSSEILKTSNNFGIASEDIAGGMELIGSKQPALLKTPKLLMEVTRAAATLSKASGQELPQTASDLLDVMNTFELGGEKATETINLLAAASKHGSAQVPFVTAAMKNAGTASKLANVSLAETVAAIEIMSEKTGLASERIGTGLKTAFLRLEKDGPKKFRPSVVGLQKALENMNAAGMGTAKMSELLGDEAIASFPALIKNAEAFKKMTQNIQGTNTAQEQAEIRMKTFNESVKKLWQNMRNELIKVFMENKEEIKSLVAEGLKAVKWVASFVKNNKQLTKWILAGSIALAALGPILVGVSAGLNVASIAFALGSKAMAGFALSSKTMTAAAVPMAAPILAAVAAIALLIKTWKELQDKDVQTGMAMWFADDEVADDATLFEDNTRASGQAQVALAKRKANMARIAKEKAAQNSSMGAKAGGKMAVDVNVKSEGHFTSDNQKIKNQKTHATAKVAGQREDR